MIVAGLSNRAVRRYLMSVTLRQKGDGDTTYASWWTLMEATLANDTKQTVPKMTFFFVGDQFCRLK